MSDTPRAADGAPAESSGTVYLHIGLFKSGTSFLQSVLLRNQEALRRNGVLFPTGAAGGGAGTRRPRRARDQAPQPERRCVGASFSQ